MREASPKDMDEKDTIELTVKLVRPIGVQLELYVQYAKLEQLIEQPPAKTQKIQPRKDHVYV